MFKPVKMLPFQGTSDRKTIFQWAVPQVHLN